MLISHRCRILMRHPSLSLSPSPSFTSDCITICVESSRQILHLTDELRKGSHYLDTTWSGTTIQLLATLTILFSVWQKRDTVTSEVVIQVKADMDLCMDIMGDVGSLLGTPSIAHDGQWPKLTNFHRLSKQTPRGSTAPNSWNDGASEPQERAKPTFCVNPPGEYESILSTLHHTPSIQRFSNGTSNDENSINYRYSSPSGPIPASTLPTPSA